MLSVLRAAWDYWRLKNLLMVLVEFWPPDVDIKGLCELIPDPTKFKALPSDLVLDWRIAALYILLVPFGIE
jgi:hypothetical protein